MARRKRETGRAKDTRENARREVQAEKGRMSSELFEIERCLCALLFFVIIKISNICQ